MYRHSAISTLVAKLVGLVADILVLLMSLFDAVEFKNSDCNILLSMLILLHLF